MPPVAAAYPLVAGPRYPAPRSSPATGLVLSSGETVVSLLAATIASLEWCSRVVAVDVTGSPEAEDAARSAGAEVIPWSGLPRIEVARRQILGDLTGWVVELRGNEICTATLADRIAWRIDEGLVSGLEASSISRIGSRSPAALARAAPAPHRLPHRGTHVRPATRRVSGRTRRFRRAYPDLRWGVHPLPRGSGPTGLRQRAERPVVLEGGEHGPRPGAGYTDAASAFRP